MARRFSNLRKAQEMKRSKDRWIREHWNKEKNKLEIKKLKIDEVKNEDD